MPKISPSLEDYLETIYLLKEKEGEIHLTDIAVRMNVAKSSVHIALHHLQDNKLIEQEKYGTITLLPAGEHMAREIYARHKALTYFFENVLGVSSETAQKDACAIEHIISQETMDRIIGMSDKKKPELIKMDDVNESKNSIKNIKDFGAAGDGISDDSAAIQAVLNKAGAVLIPDGVYLIKKTLRVHSNTHIKAEKYARILLCRNTPKKRGDFLLSNADNVNGNENISIEGGIWDGNNEGKYNVKAELFDTNGYCGAALNFVNVSNLKLFDFIVCNPAAFYIRMSKLNGFSITNICFESKKLTGNQDGLHFGGDVRNGIVDNIRALNNGQTNDDMIALNADDCVERVDNYDLVRDTIENLVISNIYAENCYTFLRILSVDAKIKNVKLSNFTGGCRRFAVNMDSARHCKTPLFNETDRPLGVGNIEDIELSDFNVHFTQKSPERAMIQCESNAENFKIRNFFRDFEKDESPDTPTFMATNVVNLRVKTTDKEFNLYNKSDIVTIDGNEEIILLNCDER